MNTHNPITIETSVHAPIEKVWFYWSDPVHIKKWNTASPEWHTPFAENELRVGGTFKSRMESIDGSMGFDFTGEYTDVITNELIRYVLKDGRMVELRFSTSGDQTQISETFDPENENSSELQRAGWQAILDHFKQYTEEN